MLIQIPLGKVGVALCWEQIRYDTVKRMMGKVDIVLAGSCWWGLSEEEWKWEYNLEKEHQNMAINAPINLAKMLQVPIIHASHFATFTGLNFPKGNKKETRTIMGQLKLLMKWGL